jgi:hypothetical protein
MPSHLESLSDRLTPLTRSRQHEADRLENGHDVALAADPVVIVAEAYIANRGMPYGSTRPCSRFPVSAVVRPVRFDRADKPIDGVVALAMALDRAEHLEQPANLLGWL